MRPVLSLRDITVSRGGRRVLDGLSLDLMPGEIVGLIGASGAGKSTLARIVLGLDRPDSGSRQLGTTNLQAVFQDPHGSLDPTHRIGRSVAEPLATRAIPSIERHRRAVQALAAVGLPERVMAARPAALSGGQRQRVAIARALIGALAGEPGLLVADEPVSALDVSVQAQVLNLLRTARIEHGLAILFISHDLEVVRYLCARVAVLDVGRIVEHGPTRTVFDAPAHAATCALLAARPNPIGMPDRRPHLSADPAAGS